MQLVSHLDQYKNIFLIQWSQNTIQKSVSIVFCVSAIRHDLSLSKYRKEAVTPPDVCYFEYFQGVTQPRTHCLFAV
jgi:hypothetical protein